MQGSLDTWTEDSIMLLTLHLTNKKKDENILQKCHFDSFVHFFRSPWLSLREPRTLSKNHAPKSQTRDNWEMKRLTDYGNPIKPFSSKSQTFGVGQTIWADKFLGIWGIFGQFISTHFGTVSHSPYISIVLYRATLVQDPVLA